MTCSLYFDWLCRKLNGVDGHFFVCLTLFDIEFFAINKFDISRIGDALDLREEFINELEKNKPENWENEIYELQQHFPTVFEVLIALAFKLQNDIIYEPSVENEADSWFWIYLENLDLIDIADSQWSYKAESYVRDRVDIFLSRKYNANGTNGNIYILYDLNPIEDVRNMSLWDQTWAFITEWLEEIDEIPF